MEFQTRQAENPWNSRFYQFVEIHGFPDCILLTCSEAKVVKKEEDMIKCVLLERLLRRTGREVDEEEPEQRQKEQRQEEERQEAPDKVV